MHIKIKSEGVKLDLPIPNGLVLNRLCAKAAGALRRHGVDIPAESAAAFARQLRACKKRFGALVLVEIQSADGDQVCITL